MIRKLLEHPGTCHVYTLVAAINQSELAGQIPEGAVVMQKPPLFDRIRSLILEVVHGHHGLEQQLFREIGA